MGASDNDTASSLCATCGSQIEQRPRGARRRYCSAQCRPSSRTIVIRMAPEAALGLAAAHRAVERMRQRLTDDEFDELFERYQWQQERIHMGTEE